jgi:hypothetical protein
MLTHSKVILTTVQSLNLTTDPYDMDIVEKLMSIQT